MKDKVNDFVTDVAGCGRFQVMTTLGSVALMVSAAWSLSFMVFGKFDPGWSCADSTGKMDDSTVTKDVIKGDLLLLLNIFWSRSNSY